MNDLMNPKPEKKSRRIGCCIYCGTTEGKLSEEHITPYGLNGNVTLVEASCKKCADITSAIESEILNKNLFAARAALGTKTRRPRNREKEQPMLVLKNRAVEAVRVKWQDQWKVIALPVYDELPAYLDGRAYSGGIQSSSMDRFELGERAEDIARRLQVDDVLLRSYSEENFARFLAKMAYGYCVYRYGLKACKKVYVLPAILGKANDIGRWVGCDGDRVFKIKTQFLTAGFKIRTNNDVMVRIKLFPMFNGAEYIVVVGQVSGVLRGFFNGLGLGG